VKKKRRIVAVLLCAALLISAFFCAIFFMFPLKYERQINEASAQFGVEPALIASIINAESGFNASAVSPRGAVGLMQILPSTFEFVKTFEVFASDALGDDLFDPKVNILAGTAYLKYLLTKFGDLKTALFAYNAGEGNTRLWLKTQSADALEKTPFAETNSYADKVLNGIGMYYWRI
jgi:soluble lytic murein transglycosylase